MDYVKVDRALRRLAKLLDNPNDVGFEILIAFEGNGIITSEELEELCKVNNKRKTRITKS